ncbi:MAG: beta-galactosidase [Ruminococcaceae bacterium]|nr:beta-galactosidase [Oscillospiraceae bacterium]
MVDLRKEYPRPQLVREDWLCLNGQWEFEIDNSESGEAREFFKREKLDGEITVPYCPESELSGVGNKDYMNCVWYKKDVEIPADWKGKRIMLHIGAIDYHARLWVNGKYVASHRGGYVPFDADVTDALEEGSNRITVCAYDHLREGLQPSGKQAHKFASSGCHYTRTTGIWQSVWLEPVSPAHLISFKAFPNISSVSAAFELEISAPALGCVAKIKASYDGRPMGEAESEINCNSVSLNVKLNEKHLWDIKQGELYDLDITIEKNGEVLDSVRAYFGLREVFLDKTGMVLNGRRVFGRWVLDQGFYPDGIYTAPSDEALKKDIEYSFALGFNGARLHEKVFEPRFLYWADKMGYPVWGEHANWGLDHSRPESILSFLPEWLEAVKRDFSHPCVIGWCPFNETWDVNGSRQYNGVIKTVYLATKAADGTRPVIDTSGNFHELSDIFDVHDYEQDVELFKSYYADIANGVINDQCERRKDWKGRQKYDGKTPVFVSEYGGIKWTGKENAAGWGYGKSVTTEEEFIARYKGLTDALLDNPEIMGFCYTQLYDVEQEVNGLMTYDRQFKFDPQIFYEINTKKAAIEQ